MWPPSSAMRAVGAHHHRQRVPAHDGGQLLFQQQAVGAARIGRLVGGAYGVDVGRVAGGAPLHAPFPGGRRQLRQQEAGALPAAGLQHGLQRVDPFGGFAGVGVGIGDEAAGGRHVHVRSPGGWSRSMSAIRVRWQPAALCANLVAKLHLDSIKCRQVDHFESISCQHRTRRRRPAHPAPAAGGQRAKQRRAGRAHQLCRRRRRWRACASLEARGVIARYVALADPHALGLTVNVFIQVSLEKQEARRAGALRAGRQPLRRGDGGLPDDRRRRLPAARRRARHPGAGALHRRPPDAHTRHHEHPFQLRAEAGQVQDRAAAGPCAAGAEDARLAGWALQHLRVVAGGACCCRCSACSSWPLRRPALARPVARAGATAAAPAGRHAVSRRAGWSGCPACRISCWSITAVSSTASRWSRCCRREPGLRVRGAPAIPGAAAAVPAAAGAGHAWC